MPVLFTRLVLENVRCFSAAEIALDPEVTIILGGNGAGKTTLVQCLASLTFGKNEGLLKFPGRRGVKAGRIALYSKGTTGPEAEWHSGRKPVRLKKERYLFAYGRYRRVFFEEEQGTPKKDPGLLLDELYSRASLNRTVTLDKPDNNLLRDMAHYLGALHSGRQSDPRLQVVWDRLNASLPELGSGLEGIQVKSSAPRVVRNGLALELKELSDGYQALLVVIFDLMLRYAALFPQLADPLEGEALVAIDEVELHLHPKWQRVVVSQLRRLFPHTQFVLTTHSPLVVQGAIDRLKSVITLQEKDGAVFGRKLTRKAMQEMEGAEVGSVLFEDKLFDLDSRYSTAIENGVLKRIEELRGLVKAHTASEADYQELRTHLNTLETYVAREDERRADGSTVAQIARIQAAFASDLLEELKRGRS